MTTNKVMAQQLAERPADEHFSTMQEFLASAKESKDTSTELTVDTNTIQFAADDDTFGITLAAAGDGIFPMTRHALEKANRILGYDLNLLKRLTTKTVINSLNELWVARTTMRGKTKVFLQTKNNTAIIRDIREESYNLAFDYDYYSLLNEFMPNGMKPAIPTINKRPTDKPALFRGDRDAMCFFSTEKDNGGNADLGGLRMGLLAWNSEVQNRSIGYEQMIFREMCGNFLIWDYQAGTKKRKYHTQGDSNFANFYRDTRRYLTEMDDKLNPDMTKVMEDAMRKPFTAQNGKYNQETKEQAIDKLREIFKQRMSKGFATDIVEATTLPQNANQTGDPELSFWTISNGLTWAGKNSKFASDIESAARMAGDVLTLSTKP